MRRRCAALGIMCSFITQPGEDVHTPEQYWQQAGLGWSSEVDQFLAPGKLRGVVAGIVAPGDTDEQKLRKIYAAVMTLENTSFTREHTRRGKQGEQAKDGKSNRYLECEARGRR